MLLKEPLLSLKNVILIGKINRPILVSKQMESAKRGFERIYLRRTMEAASEFWSQYPWRS
jgi:hypothetical protein